MRNCDCSSPNGGTPLNAPKKSASIVARGAHLPSTGAALKVKLMRVFRTSPSKIPWSTPGWLAGAAAISAFCPCPNELNNPRSLNSVALMNPLIVSVSPSPSLTTCCAVAARAPRIKTPATASVENDAIRVRMTPPRVRKWLPRASNRARQSPHAQSRLSLHRSHGETLDEAVHERVVDDGERDAREQRGRHQCPPVIHVPAHQRDRDAQTHRHLVHRADESQRVHEFLQHQREGEHDHRQDPRNDQPRRHFQDHPQPTEAVDHGLLLDVPRDRAEEPHDEPGAKWNGHRRIDEDQRPQRVLEME